ncbi:MAG: hypothetical protein WCK01_02640 [Candidatus Uhrbacteria bacterium]
MIAKRCRPTPNALTHASLHSAFATFTAVIVIKFGENGKHSFHCSPHRTFIKRFRSGTKLRASSLEQAPNNNMVVLVTSEAINLVNDELMDATFLLGAERNRLGEFRSVGRLCRFAHFHEYLEDG